MRLTVYDDTLHANVYTNSEIEEYEKNSNSSYSDAESSTSGKAGGLKDWNRSKRANL